jgi:hypothetical protein
MSEEGMSIQLPSGSRGRRLRFGLGLLVIAAIAGCSVAPADGGTEAATIAAQVTEFIRAFARQGLAAYLL